MSSNGAKIRKAEAPAAHLQGKGLLQLIQEESKTLLFLSFSTNQLTIVLGRTSRATPEENEQKFQVKNYTVHQRFDSENFNNDIGKNFSDLTGKVTVGSNLWLMKRGFFFPLQLCCS